MCCFDIIVASAEAKLISICSNMTTAMIMRLGILRNLEPMTRFIHVECTTSRENWNVTVSTCDWSVSPNFRSHWLKETPIRFIPDFELHCYYKLQMINHAYNTQSIAEHRKSSWLKTWKLEDAKVSRVADGVKFKQGDVALEWKHSHGKFVPISSVVTINLLTLFCSGCSDSEQKPCK